MRKRYFSTTMYHDNVAIKMPADYFINFYEFVYLQYNGKLKGIQIYFPEYEKTHDFSLWGNRATT